MNWKTENKSSYNFYQSTSSAYKENFDRAQNNTEVKPPKVFKVADCNRCHIKVSTHDGNCPSCGEPVEV